MQTWFGAAAANTARVHLAVRWVAVVVVAFSAGGAWLSSYETEEVLAVLVMAMALALTAVLRRHRSRDLAAAAAVGGVASLMPDASLLWPGLVGLVVLAIVNESAVAPWVAGVVGLVGSVLSVVLFADDASLAPFVAVATGGVIGLLVRQLDRTDALTRQARKLEDRSRASEDQTRWLEQRTNLARELHDVVGHHVTAMVVQAEAGRVGEPDRALLEIGRLGRTALGELDALVVHLRDPEADLVVSAPPRLADIDELLAAPLRSSGVVVAVAIAPDLDLDEVQVMTLYRIAQEALTNVTRHADAGQAWVEVARTTRHVRLRVSDDGIGPPAVAPERGSGLVGIEERVGALGGMWTLSGRPGGGTIVDVFLPVAPLVTPVAVVP